MTPKQADAAGYEAFVNGAHTPEARGKHPNRPKGTAEGWAFVRGWTRAKEHYDLGCAFTTESPYGCSEEAAEFYERCVKTSAKLGKWWNEPKIAAEARDKKQ